MRRALPSLALLPFLSALALAGALPGGGGANGNGPTPPSTQTSASSPAHPADHKTQGIVIRLDDFGSADIAYLTLPDQPPIGGIVIAHDAWGLNWGISALADRLANAGYIVLVPDFFSGQTTADPLRAAEMMRDVTADTAAKTLGAAVRFLRESPRFRAGRVAVVGIGAGATACLPVADLKASKAAGGGSKGVRIDALALVGGPFTFTDDAFSRVDRRADLLALEGSSATADARAAFAALLKDQKRTADVDTLPDEAEPTANVPLPDASFARLDTFLKKSFAAPEKKGAMIGAIDAWNPFRDKDADAAAPKASPATAAADETTAAPATAVKP